VGADEQSLDGPVAVKWRVSVGHPFDRQRWPGECMGVERVVEEWGMLLPYFVLLEYALFFELVSVVN